MASQTDIFSIEIKLTGLDHYSLRTHALAIPTAFRISEVARGLLRQAAKRSLWRSAEIERFLQSLPLAP